MGILRITTDTAGQIDVLPRRVKIITTDNLATVTTAGYLNSTSLEGYTINNTDIIDMWYGAVGTVGGGISSPGTYDVFLPTISNGIITLAVDVSAGNVLLPVVSGNFAIFNGTTGQIKDGGFLPSDNTKTRVVMESGASVVGDIPKYADVTGTIVGSGISPSDATKTKMVMESGASVIGNFPKYADVNGTIQDSAISPSDSTKTKAVMANGAVTVGHIGVFTDVAGTLGQDAATAINLGNIQAGDDTTKGQLLAYGGSSNGHIIINPIGNTGNTAITIQNAIFGQASVLTIPDPGVASASFLLSEVAGGQSVSSSSAVAGPGSPIRALMGSMTQTVDLTSGNIVGVRGVVNMVGASAGFIYGTQGKVIATGTISGSVWIPAVYGQFDVSAATINGGIMAPIWGDWGATGAIASDMSGTAGFKFTNTTANKLNAQVDTYGDADFLWWIRGNPGPLTYYLAAGTSAGSAGDAAHCAAQQVLVIKVQGDTVYIPVFTQNT